MKILKKVAVFMIAGFVLSGCAATGLFAVYKHKESGNLFLVYDDKTIKQIPFNRDGAQLTGVIEHWQKENAGLAPSALAVVQIKPDGSFDIKWTKEGKGVSQAVLDVITGAVSNQGALPKYIEKALPTINETTTDSTTRTVK